MSFQNLESKFFRETDFFFLLCNYNFIYLHVVTLFRFCAFAQSVEIGVENSQIFREINASITGLYRMLFHRIFFTEHSVRKFKVYSQRKIFRQINSLITFMVKALFSRNFYPKSV